MDKKIICISNYGANDLRYFRDTMQAAGLDGWGLEMDPDGSATATIRFDNVSTEEAMAILKGEDHQ